jgi:hypothetical protein
MSLKSLYYYSSLVPAKEAAISLALVVDLVTYY